MAPRGEQPAASDDFASFYRATAPQTFRAACRMAAGDQHVARDATQEAYVAMLRLWPKRRGMPLDDNRRYVIGIASKKVADWYRLSDNQNTGLADEFDLSTEDVGFAEVLDEHSVLSATRRLIDGQPSRRRVVAVLFFLEGWRYREIAAALGISESTVRTHVERLRNLLKPLIDQIRELDRGGERP